MWAGPGSSMAGCPVVGGGYHGGLGLSIKKSLFPVQWVAKIVASREAAFFFPHVFFLWIG